MISKKAAAILAAAPLALALAAIQPGYTAEGKADAKDTAKKGANVDTKKRGTSQSTQAVEMVTLADSLIQYGDRNKDAMAMIMAARIQNQLGVKDETGQPAKMEGKGAPGQRNVSTSAVLERARSYAGGRKDLIALADEAAKTGTRQAVGGPIRRVFRVDANASHTWTITFRGGEPAIVAISGDGDTDLDLYVYDARGNRICIADGYTDDEICRWTPLYTETFTVRVVNRGGVWNEYRLVTN